MNILCVVAHPDDETLGCGATLAKHTAAADRVHVVCLADGVSSRGEADLKRRRAESESACASLGALVEFHDLVDNRMDAHPLITVVALVEEALRWFRPSIVYTHHAGDLNVDHRITHAAVNVACRPQPGCTVKQLLYFEVPCSTAWGAGFQPTWYVDVTATIEKKLSAAVEYASELRDWPHPRSLPGINYLAAMRGAAIGVQAAEAFVVGRVCA